MLRSARRLRARGRRVRVLTLADAMANVLTAPITLVQNRAALPD